jgi:hypothetical protein
VALDRLAQPAGARLRRARALAAAARPEGLHEHAEVIALPGQVVPRVEDRRRAVAVVDLLELADHAGHRADVQPPAPQRVLGARRAVAALGGEHLGPGGERDRAALARGLEPRIAARGALRPAHHAVVLGAQLDGIERHQRAGQPVLAGHHPARDRRGQQVRRRPGRAGERRARRAQQRRRVAAPADPRADHRVDPAVRAQPLGEALPARGGAGDEARPDPHRAADRAHGDPRLARGQRRAVELAERVAQVVVGDRDRQLRRSTGDHGEPLGGERSGDGIHRRIAGGEQPHAGLGERRARPARSDPERVPERGGCVGAAAVGLDQVARRAEPLDRVVDLGGRGAAARQLDQLVDRAPAVDQRDEGAVQRAAQPDHVALGEQEHAVGLGDLDAQVASKRRDRHARCRRGAISSSSSCPCSATPARRTGPAPRCSPPRDPPAGPEASAPWSAARRRRRRP